MADRRAGLAAPIALCLVLQAGLGLVLAELYCSTHNSLYNNGNWTATKTTLEEAVMGAYSYLFSLQPLAGDRLDLTAWHGFQEVVLSDAVDPVSVEFDFQLKKGAYLAFEFNRNQAGYDGIRISRSRQFPPIVFHASADGEFMRKEPFGRLRRASVGRWQTLSLELGEGQFAVSLDGKPLKRFEAATARPQRIGFRGGRYRSYVDNVRIVSRDGSSFHDSFGRPRSWLAVYLGSVGAVLALSALLFLLLRRFTRAGDRRLLFNFLMFSGLLLVLAGIVSGFASYRKGFYPNQGERMRLEEAYWRDALAERIFRGIEDSYPRRPEPGIQRLLFVGSSQTRGAGARRSEQTFVRRTERLLNARAGEPRFECINGGVSAFKMADMAREFSRRWVGFHPATVLVNASNNNVGHNLGVFEKDLAGLVREARDQGIQAVLIMEPNSAERDLPALRKLHRVMAQVAARSGIPAIDMHQLLLDRYDDGFLWWDWVHLTSYGQRLFADLLVDELVRLGVVDLAASPPPP